MIKISMKKFGLGRWMKTKTRAPRSWIKTIIEGLLFFSRRIIIIVLRTKVFLNSPALSTPPPPGTIYYTLQKFRRTS